jgi:hypothetical protein
MGDAHLEVGAGFEDPAEDEDRCDQRVLHDHAEAVVQAVAGRAGEHEVVLGLGLGMEEQHRAHRLGGLEQRKEARLVPVVALDEGVELGALEAEHVHRAGRPRDSRGDTAGLQSPLSLSVSRDDARSAGGGSDRR